MKVVIASTLEQEDKIRELINTIYQDIFPRYFSDEEIQYFEELKVLHTTTRHFEYFGTLREAFQVIASLQTLISILEVKDVKACSKEYEEIFEKNVAILQSFGLFFPFTLEQFYSSTSAMEFSIYAKAANELPI
ncbi:MAG TPA: YhcU family protein [Chondromyces sp.]|nr:YhcU family protein [Chondromyces sp.]